MSIPNPTPPSTSNGGSANVAHSTLRLHFGAQHNAAQYFSGGWSTPEAEETWSLGTSSRLTLPVNDPSQSHILVLSLRPHVQSGSLPVQRLRVLANGTPVGTFTLSRRGMRACGIPTAVLNGQSNLDLTFETPDAARPTTGSDRRVLSIAFSSLSLYPDIQHPKIPASRPSSASLSPAELVQQFESLGQNCEFGLVQRRCDAEPLGLLRFASAPLAKLLAALDAGFANMGAPDRVRVELSSNGREFMVTDTTYDLVYHAWVDAGEMTAEALHRRETRRVPLLVRKLLEDLESGEKIFVFKGMGALPEEEVYPLAALLRRYGPNTLLFVTIAPDPARVGTVERKAPGFLVGYLDRFAPGDDAHNLSFEPWMRLCRNAYDMAHSDAGG